MYGLENSRGAGEGSLGSYILNKAVKSRDEAKAEKKKQDEILAKGGEVKEKDRKNLFGKALLHNFGGRKITGAKSFSQNFTYKKPPKEENQSPNGKPKVGQGLRQILLSGFGSLITDTTQIQGGLASTTELLNQQLQMQGMTASGIQSMQATLGDQLEVQTSMLDAFKNGSTLGGVGGAKKGGLYGSAKSKGAGEGSILSYIKDQVQQAIQSSLGFAGAGAAGGILPKLLFSPAGPYIALAALATVGGIAKIKESERMKPLVDKNQKEIDQTMSNKDAPWYQKLGGFFANESLNAPGGPKNPIGLTAPGNFSSGGLFKYAAGGASMVGEAGKEAVVDLNSADARNKMRGGDAMDPSMKVVGGSILAVTDAFIKALGPMGDAVSQTIGPEVQNLSTDFGMSSALPNLRIGGSQFRDNSNAKKEREKFLLDLISGSLKYLGAKPKEKPKAPTAGATGPGSTGTAEQKQAAQQRAETAMEEISPSGFKQTTMTSNGKQVNVLETKEKIKGTTIGTTSPDIFGREKNVDGPGPQYRPVQGTNKQRWYDRDGRLYTWQPGTTARALTPQEMSEGWNGRTYLRKPAATGGHVRAYQGSLDIFNITPGVSTPAIGEYSYTKGKVLVPQKVDPKKGTWQDQSEEKGPYGGLAPSLPPATDIQLQSGGYVKPKLESGDGMMGPSWMPWNWGKLVDQQRSTKSTQYAMKNSPLAGMARQREMMKEMGYEQGGNGCGGNCMKPKLESGDGMMGPSWMPWNWGKLVDQHRNTKSTDYANPNGILGQAAKQREMMKEYGYEKGGSTNSMYGVANYEKTPEQIIFGRLNVIEKTMKELMSGSSSTPKMNSASTPITATSNVDTNYAPVIVNMGGGSGGMSMPITVPQPQQESSAKYSRAPEPGGLAAVVCLSGSGVL